MDPLKKANEFLNDYLATDGRLTPLPQSGSARINYVAEGKDKKFILTQNENILENESFLYFSTVFSELQLNTPKILSVSKDKTMYLQEFLGEQTLFEYFPKVSSNEELQTLLQSVLEKLYDLQMKTQGQIDYSKTFEYEKYNDLPILHDLNYFKFLLVDILEIPYHKTRLLTEFKKLTHLIEQLGPKGLMIRDFQSRNIMLGPKKEIYFIDYQSAMYGPLLYDVVSFLYQAKAPFSAKLRKEMLTYYLNLFEDSTQRKELKQGILPLRLIRSLQVLGAYGLRGLVQRKPHFLSSLENGIKNTSALSRQWKEMAHFPELHSVIQALESLETKEKLGAFLDSPSTNTLK